MRLRSCVAVAYALFVSLTVSAGVNQWTENGPEGGEVLNVAFSPLRPGVAWAATPAGLFYTADGGMTWMHRPVRRPNHEGLEYSSVHVVAPSPQRSNVVYAGGSSGLFRSDDDGLTWSAAEQVDGKQFYERIGSIVIDPANDAHVIAGSDNYGGVFETADGGVTFHRLTIGGKTAGNVRALAATRDFSAIYALVDNDIYVRLAGRTDWVMLSRPDPAKPTIDDGFAIDPNHGETVFASTYGTIYRSANRGMTWEEVYHAPSSGSMAMISVDPRNPAVMNAMPWGGAQRLLHSGDAGLHWVPAPEPVPNRAVIAFGFDPFDAGRTLASVLGRGIFETRDNTSWVARNTGLRAQMITALAVDQDHPSRIFVGTSPFHAVLGGAGDVHRTLDGGQTWSVVGSNPYDGITDVAILGTTPEVVLAGGTAGYLRSTNGGSTFTFVMSSGVSLHVFGTSSLMPSRVYGAGFYHGVYRSDDAGQTWSQTATWKDFNWEMFNSVTVSPASPDIAFGVTGFVHKTMNGGISWTEQNPPTLDKRGGYNVSFDPHEPSTVYASISRGADSGVFGVYVSHDLGATWEQKPNPGRLMPRWVMCDAERPRTIYQAASSRGVFRSADGGETWMAMGDLESRIVSELEMTTGTVRRFYAVTGYAGLLTYDEVAPGRRRSTRH